MRHPSCFRTSWAWNITLKLRNPSSIQRCCLLYFSNLPDMLSSTSLRTVSRRSNGVRLCVKLCELLQDQPLMKALVLCQCVLASTKTVLQAARPVRNVPFVREISYFAGNVDSSLWPDNVLGLPTVGWALHAPTQIQLDHVASSTIQDLLANVEIKNNCVISRTRPSSDPVFDEEAWSKTKDQIAMNVATHPVDDSSEIPFPQLCLVRRHGRWEQLSEFMKLLVRVVDDSSLKMDKTTQPTLGETYSCNLMMFCSYLAKPFRQIPAAE